MSLGINMDNHILILYPTLYQTIYFSEGDACRSQEKEHGTYSYPVSVFREGGGIEKKGHSFLRRCFHYSPQHPEEGMKITHFLGQYHRH